MLKAVQVAGTWQVGGRVGEGEITEAGVQAF